MEFKHIEYFVETCNYKSFSRAASSLFISQQALNRSISNLEEELGCSLFIRTVKGISLTDEGKYLYHQFQPVVRNFSDIVSQTVSYLENRPVALSFCCAPGVTRTIPPELFISFREQHPNINLNIIEVFDKQCEEYIHMDTRRFGFISAPHWLHTRRHSYIIIKEEPACLLVHKDHPFAARSSVSMSMLRHERILAMGKESYFQEILEYSLKPYNFIAQPFFETSDVKQLCEMVNQRIGIMIGTKRFSEESKCANVVQVPLEERTFDYCYAFVFQDYDKLDEVAKQFIRFVLDNIEADPVKNALPVSADGGASTVKISERQSP